MGEVFLAEDTRLDRRVAIKFLQLELTADERAKKRLIREAQAAAKLDHPCICPIYEVADEAGRAFIVMQYVEGETLADLIARARLPIPDAVGIATQVAEALIEAHSHGIVHRDIKPQNIMVTAGKRVKVLDFGLAKLIPTGDMSGDNRRAESIMTEAGMIIGTVPYMSPEQVSGESLDLRSDIFSFGAVLYEMVTGNAPFVGNNPAAIMAAILTQVPPALKQQAPEAPPRLQQILDNCLAKDPGQRYNNARELAEDLRDVDLPGSARSSRASVRPLLLRSRRLAAAAAAAVLVLLAAAFALYRMSSRHPALDSIAVLPLNSAAADEDAVYLSDGIAESLINSLSQMPRLRVVARTTVFRYRDSVVDPQRVGRDLGVGAVLTGKLSRRGNQLLVQADLIDVASGAQLWGDRYVRTTSDVFAVQDEIVQRISERLRVRLTGEEQQRLVKRYTDNSEAYRLYLKGRFFWDKRTASGMETARQLYKQAIDLDPSYALAYSGLADTYVFCQCPTRRTETIPLAKAYAERALQLDESLAEPHATLGFIKMNYEFDWKGAEGELERAVQLSPSYPVAHQFYAGWLLQQGQFESGLAEAKRAVELDPLSLAANWYLGASLYHTRRYDEAIEQLRRTIQMEPKYPLAHSTLGLAYLQRKLYREALAELKLAQELRPESDETESHLGYAYATVGNTPAAEKKLAGLLAKSSSGKAVSDNLPLLIARLELSLGRTDEAMQWLNRAYEQRSFGLFFLKVDPTFDPLRADPRFAAFLNKIGLAGDARSS
jgi:TolB-like protein/Tfp pilus assembly protein PilF/predicted Ser/Thr protein kinase